jgi:peptide/nickel transport system substrate-binding protein
MIQKKVTIILIIIFVSFLLLRCSSGEASKTSPKISIEKLKEMKESPMLAEMVQSGQLPPLEDRLPDEPLVIEPYEKPGSHGGTWHFDIINRRDVNLVYHIANPSFVRWDRDGINAVPHFCKKYEMSKDGRIWTFYLRKGVKWSDGHPFTSEDVRFWYEDDAMNRDINPIPKQELQIGNKFGKVEIVNDYIFKVVFPDSNKGFYQKLTSIVLFYSPSHYLKQFHKKYTSNEELDKKMEMAGVKKWSELLKKMDRWYFGYLNPDRPTMRPWILSKKRGSPDTYEFVRNPYYWAVDTFGKQLPYIDRIVVKISSNDQVLAMNTIAGDFDFQWRRLDFKDYPLLKENEKKQRYDLLTWPQDRCSDIALYINYNCKHPVVGPLLQEVKFRIALSHAINREEINLLFYKNIGIPRQATAAENTPFFVPDYAKTYAKYDSEKANNLLDELGLTQRDTEGYRLDQNGIPFMILIESVASGNTIDILQIVAEHLQKIGIRAEVKIIEGSLLIERTKSAKVMIQARPMGSFNPPLSMAVGSSNYIAPIFGLWYNTLGRDGEKPEGDFKRIIDLSEKRKNSDLDEEIGIMKEIYKIYSENMWIIGLVGEIPALLAKKKYFMNVPEKSLYSWARGRRLGLTIPEQYWIDPVSLLKDNKK